MKTHRLTYLWGVVLILACAFGASTREAAYAGRYLHGMYDPATVVTVKGRVINLVTNEFEFRRKMMREVRVNLKTDKGNVVVFLGPEEYVSAKITLGAGDLIEVTGSVLPAEGGDGIAAREVKKGDLTVPLRKEDGTPLWPMGSGMKRRER